MIEVQIQILLFKKSRQPFHSSIQIIFFSLILILLIIFFRCVKLIMKIKAVNMLIRLYSFENNLIEF